MSTDQDHPSTREPQVLALGAIQVVFPEDPSETKSDKGLKLEASSGAWSTSLEVTDTSTEAVDSALKYDFRKHFMARGAETFREQPREIADCHGRLIETSKKGIQTRILQLAKGARLYELTAICGEESQIGRIFIESAVPRQESPSKGDVEVRASDRERKSIDAKEKEPPSTDGVPEDIWLSQLYDVYSHNECRAVLLARRDAPRLTVSVLHAAAELRPTPEPISSYSRDQAVESAHEMVMNGVSSDRALRLASATAEREREVETQQKVAKFAALLTNIAKLRGESPARPYMKDLSQKFLCGQVTQAEFWNRYDRADPTYPEVSAVMAYFRSSAKAIPLAASTFDQALTIDAAREVAVAIVDRAQIPFLLERPDLGVYRAFRPLPVPAPKEPAARTPVAKPALQTSSASKQVSAIVGFLGRYLPPDFVAPAQGIVFYIYRTEAASDREIEPVVTSLVQTYQGQLAFFALDLKRAQEQWDQQNFGPLGRAMGPYALGVNVFPTFVHVNAGQVAYLANPSENVLRSWIQGLGIPKTMA